MITKKIPRLTFPAFLAAKRQTFDQDSPSKMCFQNDSIQNKIKQKQHAF